MPGISIFLRRMGYKYDFLPTTFATTIMSNGHSVARKREPSVLLSSYLFAGTNLSW